MNSLMQEKLRLSSTLSYTNLRSGLCLFSGTVPTYPFLMPRSVKLLQILVLRGLMFRIASCLVSVFRAVIAFESR